MNWISVKEVKPPESKILVYGKCGMPHVAIYSYGEHCHTEYCNEDHPGDHFTGCPIEFTHWMPLPEVPK